VPTEALENPHVVVRKYYVPVEAGHAIADDLYDRVVNLPSHPGMAVLSDVDLEQVLVGFLDGAD
jgi:hypothetical protein